MDEYNTVSGADAAPESEKSGTEESVSEGDMKQFPSEEIATSLPPSSDYESMVLAINYLQADVNTGIDKLSSIGIALIVIVGFIAGCVWMKGFWTGGKKI